ncbi:hypothetical protein CVT24_013298 [Panaeolus cyanescens]|uniref:Uncharacterized protein n=1 Tax=Panaeolus cyanescens TaxID=181874 RepID=A0A409WAF6_9AGAR|nr:hypothetical protein CVT24_013298 [Panaeolus cyanescens]
MGIGQSKTSQPATATSTNPQPSTSAQPPSQSQTQVGEGPTHKSHPSQSTTLPTSAGTTLPVVEYDGRSSTDPEHARDRDNARDREWRDTVGRHHGTGGNANGVGVGERRVVDDLEIGTSSVSVRKKRDGFGSSASVDEMSSYGGVVGKRERGGGRKGYDEEWYGNDPSNTSHSRRDTSFSQSQNDDDGSGEWDEEEEWVRGAGGRGVGARAYGDDDEGSIK